MPSSLILIRIASLSLQLTMAVFVYLGPRCGFIVVGGGGDDRGTNRNGGQFDGDDFATGGDDRGTNRNGGQFDGDDFATGGDDRGTN